MDAQLAPFARRSGPAATERLVAEATARFEPARAAAEAAVDAAERRHVRVSHGQVSFDGTCAIRAELDLADALDLEDALAREAATLAAAGCEESLDVRRSLSQRWAQWWAIRWAARTSRPKSLTGSRQTEWPWLAPRWVLSHSARKRGPCRR